MNLLQTDVGIEVSFMFKLFVNGDKEDSDIDPREEVFYHTDTPMIDTVKSLLEAHALIEAHFTVWMPKMPIFQANFPKNQASNKGPPTNIEK